MLVPAKDEAENLPLFMEQAAAAFAGSPHRYEVVVIDDGSIDRTWPVLQQLAEQYSVPASSRGIARGAASPTRCAPATSPRAATCSCSIPPTCSSSPRTFRASSRRFSPATPTWSPGFKEGKYEKAFVSGHLQPA